MVPFGFMEKLSTSCITFHGDCSAASPTSLPNGTVLLLYSSVFTAPMTQFGFSTIIEKLYGRVECTLCGAECESVVHVLWECSSYSTCRDNFQEALKQLLGARYAEFETLSAVEKNIICAR